MFCDLPEGFLEDLESLGISREDVDTVMCTHLHFDHVGWNTYKDPATGEYKPTFPNARYLFGSTEYDAWQNASATTACTPTPTSSNASTRSSRAGMADFIEADHEIAAPGIWCEPSHGHTPGHVHVRISSQGRGSGHHRRPDAPPDAGRDAAPPGDVRHGQGGRPPDPRMGFVEKYADSGVLVIGAHFAGPTAGHIRTYGADDVRFDGLRPVSQADPRIPARHLHPRGGASTRAQVDDALREFAPVVRLADGTHMLGRHEHVAAGLLDWKAFSSASRPWHDPTSPRPEILLTDDPPRHTQVRKVIADALQPARARAGEGHLRGARAGTARPPARPRGRAGRCGRRGRQAYVFQVLPDILGLPERRPRAHARLLGDGLGDDGPARASCSTRRCSTITRR